MRFVFLMLYLSIISISSSSQTINLVAVTPNEFKGRDKTNLKDDGVRPLQLSLILTGKHKASTIYLSIPSNKTASQPRLLDSVIQIRKKDISRNTVKLPVRVQLHALGCMVQDEYFEIELKDKKTKQANPKITIKRFTDIPDKPTITLNEDSTIVKPYQLFNDSIRYVVLSVTLSGKPPAADSPISFIIPPYIRSDSKPGIENRIEMKIPQNVFSSDGCPTVLEIPIIIELAKIEGVVRQENIPILRAGDYKHAHTLIIRPDSVKTPPRVPVDTSRPGLKFTYSCIQRNFTITIKPDSIGGTIEVRDKEKNNSDTFNYRSFFHTGNFSQWFFNLFSTGANARNICNDCASCASYLSERIYEELVQIKKATIDAKAETAATLKTDSAKTAQDKEKNANITAKTIPDTISFTGILSYADTSLYNLEIKRLKSKTDIKLCRDPKKGKDSCNSRSIGGELTRKSFERNIIQMLETVRGGEAFDQSKLSPAIAEIYSKYIEALEKENANPKDTLTATRVGIIYLKDSLANIYDKNDKFIRTTKIDSVVFTIESGKLVKRLLYVETKDGTFSNKLAPVSVIRLNKRSKDRLYNLQGDDEFYIELGEALTFRSHGGYVPDDADNLVVSPRKRAIPLSAASNLNSLVNMAVYTDLAALVGRRPNGIVNSDISGKFITNTGNVSNHDITPFSFIEANIALSKFDSKYKSLDSLDIKPGLGGEKDTIDRMQLIQTAWLRGTIKFNVATTRFWTNQYMQINIGTRINVANADSLYGLDQDVISFEYFPELVYNINRLKNFGMDLSIRWIFQRIADRENFANKGWEKIFNPQVSFFYYPVENANGRIYFRFNYFANHKKDAKNFYQLQLGFKTSLKLSK